MRRRLLMLLCCTALLTFHSVAQQQPTPPSSRRLPTQASKADQDDVVKITSNLVQVDAVVTDKDGKLVSDLKPEELQVFEDGNLQRITHFSYVVTETALAEPRAKTVNEAKAGNNLTPPPRSIPLKREDVRRTIAIVVDDLGLSAESIYQVKLALKKFVNEQMQPGDLVAIVRSRSGSGALQNFTADKRQLLAAIERIKWYPLGRAGLYAVTPLDVPVTGEHAAEIEAQINHLEQFRQDVFSVGTLGAVNYVINGLRDLPGRKSILLISDGFRINPDDDRRVLDKVRNLVDEAGRASVVVYTMNAIGLQPFGLTAADYTGTPEQTQTKLNERRQAAWDNQDGMDFLARETGGIPIRNTNDLAGGIRRVLEDQKGYYLIGFRPDESTFDQRTGRRTYHHLSMKVTRPGKFNVRMRNGFFGITDEQRRPPQTTAQQLLTALMSPFAATGVHLQLTSIFANDPQSGSFMRSLLYIDPHDLTFTDEPNGFHQCVFDIVAITYGDNGVMVDQVGRTYTVSLPDEWYRKTIIHGLVYNVTVPIKKPGAYQLRISLRDTSTMRIGSASQFIQVPDLKNNRLALSGIVLSKTDSPNNNSTNLPPAPEGAEQINSEASPAVRRFRQGMFLSYGYLIYNAKIDKVASKPQLTTQLILSRDGKPIFTGNVIPFNPGMQPDLKRLIASGAIQLGTDLPPGEYLLQILVTDTLADKKNNTTTQWMDFQVVK